MTYFISFSFMEVIYSLLCFAEIGLQEAFD